MRLVNNGLELPYGASSLVIGKLSFKYIYVFLFKIKQVYNRGLYIYYTILLKRLFY